MTVFQKAVLRIVQRIPFGTVASYGQIAAYLGTPRAARQVGWAMRSLEGEPDFPWWRVLNNAGKITIKGGHFNAAQLQKDLLQAEDIVVSADFTLDMARYRFRPDDAWLQDAALSPEYARTVLAKYDIA